MSINLTIQTDAGLASQAGAAQSSSAQARIKPELVQNLPIADSSVPATRVSLPVERDQAAGDRGPSRDDLAQAVNAINERIQTQQRELQFSVDDKSGRVVVKVVNTQTKEVIRQIPPEEVLELAQRLDKDTGVLLEASV